MKADLSPRPRRRVSVALVALLFVLGGCGQKPSQVRLTPTKSTLYGMKSRTVLTVEVLDKKNQTVAGLTPELTSSNTKVAAVEASGLVRAVGPGKAVVTAKLKELQATSAIEVIDVATITVTPGRTTLAGPKGTTLKYTAVVKDSFGGLSPIVPKWSSSDDKIASVNEKGEAASLSEGRTTITASLGDIAGFSDLAVVFRQIAFFDVNPKQLILRVGESQKVTALVKDPKGTPIEEAAIVWSTSDPAIVTCVGNSVTGHSQGAATIRGLCGSLTTEISVIVN